MPLLVMLYFTVSRKFLVSDQDHPKIQSTALGLTSDLFQGFYPQLFNVLVTCKPTDTAGLKKQPLTGSSTLLLPAEKLLQTQA